VRRVWVVGLSGSGKTTLALRLARLLQVPHIEIDAIHWGLNWTPLDRDLLRQRIAEATDADGWTIDGNYSNVTHVIAQRADTVVWLDLPLLLVLWRLLTRTIARALSPEPLWGGNRENLTSLFFSRDSLFLWTLTTASAKRTRYIAMQRDPALAHLTWYRLRSPAEVSRWLALQEQALAQPTEDLAQEHPRHRA